MKWIVDDCGRVAALNPHPVALWASSFDLPIKAVLDLGFICIEDRSRSLIIALNASKVQPTTLAGTLYFLADHNVKRIIIYSNFNTELAYYTIVFDINGAFRMLEEMISSARNAIPLIVHSLENKIGKRRICRIRLRSSAARLNHSIIAEEEQSANA
jgi:hypothetical protein